MTAAWRMSESNSSGAGNDERQDNAGRTRVVANRRQRDNDRML